MTKEFALDRIQKAQETIAKKNNTITKKTALMAKKTDEYEIRWLKEDIIRLQGEIKEAEGRLQKYQSELQIILEKEGSRNVTVILEFLEVWKQKTKAYYMNLLTEFFTEKNGVTDLYNKYNAFMYGSDEYKEAKAIYEKASKQFRINRKGEYILKDAIRWNKPIKVKVKVSDGKYEGTEQYQLRTLEEAEAKLDKDLIQEANNKYDFIIERTNYIVGQITDVTNLHTSYGNLNGFIIGTKGTAKVETIGAGGFNVQCFHFRTLIHEMK